MRNALLLLSIGGVVNIRFLTLATAVIALSTIAIPNPADAAGSRDDVATVRDLPPLTPKNHPRIMTMMDATSASDCIGRPVTPLCAVETKMACFLRNDDSLCEVAVGESFNLSGMIMAPASLRYRVTKAAIVDDRHFPWPPIDKIFEPDRIIPRVKVGDVRIEVRKQMCFDFSALNCEKSGSVIIYVIRKVNRFWQLQGWAGKALP